MTCGSGVCKEGLVHVKWVRCMSCGSGECSAGLVSAMRGCCCCVGLVHVLWVPGCEAAPVGVVGVQVGLQCGSGYIRYGSDKSDTGPVHAMGVQRMPWALVQQNGSGVCSGGLAHAMRVRCGPDA